MLGTLALSGFFTYEVCRKLDPSLPLVCGRREERGGEGRKGTVMTREDVLKQ